MNTPRAESPLPEDLRVFLTVIRKSGFAAAADELGLSPAYVSKRIRLLEVALGTRLLHRNARSLALTDAGERAQRWAIRILGDMDDFVGEMKQVRQEPRGVLHLCSSFGFGRNHVAPAVAQLSAAYPALEIRLDVFDRVVDIVAEGFDLEIRIGDDLPAQHIGRKLASNQRVLCATPEYLAQRGTPLNLKDLDNHDCLVLKERNNPFGVWQLQHAGREETVRSAGRCRRTMVRSFCSGRWAGGASCCVLTGMYGHCWRAVGWCRCCTTTPRVPMSGRCTRRAWRTRRNCACAWSFSSGTSRCCWGEARGHRVAPVAFS